ncbi:uncharacterized protein N7529_001882 [Penicillium soppii]|uniref:uncharacterized protein n=1 Tax=Penicillium soppii TaxID=69789 RepID=UPI002547132C|nr:uncharacterized protein N7529_001882 [Penicillium soppii]KAJ5876298.1 hypothetical protein N7529_001882 [Penicillium soppii]
MYQELVFDKASLRVNFDAKFTMIGQCDPDDCHSQQDYFEVVKVAGQKDAWAHKYLVGVDGNAFSGRFYVFFLCTSFIYKISHFREKHEVDQALAALCAARLEWQRIHGDHALSPKFTKKKKARRRPIRLQLQASNTDISWMTIANN